MGYQTQAATALRLITAKGAPITLRRRAASGISLVTDRAADVVASYSAKAVLLPNLGTLGSSFDEQVGTSELREHSSKRLLIAAQGLPITPLPGDVAVFPNGREYTLATVVTLSPDGVTEILHTCSVKV